MKIYLYTLLLSAMTLHGMEHNAGKNQHTTKQYQYSDEDVDEFLKLIRDASGIDPAECAEQIPYNYSDAEVDDFLEVISNAKKEVKKK